MSPSDEVVVGHDSVTLSEIDRVFSVIGIEIFFGIGAGDSVIVGDRYVLAACSFWPVAPALEVLSPRERPSRIQQEVPGDGDTRPSLHLNIGFAVGEDASLDSKVRGFNGEDSIVMITASRALGFRVDVAVKDANTVATAYRDAVAGARTDLRVLNCDVLRIHDPDTIALVRSDLQPLDNDSTLSADHNGF